MGRMEILVYSREKDICRMLVSQFGDLVLSADTEEEAKKYICGRDIRLALIDLEMPEGIALAYYLRGIHRLYLTPVVFLAPDGRYEEQAFREIRCHDYLRKPVSPAEILEIVNLLSDRLDPGYIPKGIVIRLRSGVYRFEISDVLYIEILNKRLFIHTLYEVWEFPYRPLAECIAQGRGELVQCHRAMAVNRRFVDRVDYLNRRIKLRKRQESVLLGPKYIKGICEMFDAEGKSGYTKDR